MGVPYETTTVTRELDANPGHLIRRAHQISVSLFLEECRDAAITPIQYAVLAVLARRPDLDQITLANQVALDRSTLGDVADRMEKKGLIRRIPNPQDRRQKLLTLTDEGAAALQTTEPAVGRVGQRILAPLSAEEQKLFLTLLGKIVDHNNDSSRAPFKDAL